MVYSIIILLLIFGIVNFDLRKNKIGESLYTLLVFTGLIMLSSLRFRVGGDTLFYEDIYPYMPDLNNYLNYVKNENYYKYQPLWLLLVALCKTISSEFTFFQFVHSLIFNVSIFFFIRRYTQKTFTFLLILFLSLYYFYYSFEIQRETMAICIFLFNIKNIERKRWLRYYILAFLSFMFHISAIIVFLFPFFGLIKLTNRSFMILIISGLIIVPFKSQIFELISNLFLLDVMAEKSQIYSQIEFSLVGFISFYIVRVILLIPIFAVPKRFEIMPNWFFSAFVIISIFSQLFVGTERFLNYLVPLYIIYIIRIFYNIKIFSPTVGKRHIVVFCTVLHLFFALDWRLFTKNEYGEHYYSLFYPYQSIFNPKINQERESFYRNVFE